MIDDELDRKLEDHSGEQKDIMKRQFKVVLL